MDIQTISIIGQGALGILYGKVLTDALGKQSVRFIASQKRMDRYQKDGIYCNGERCDFAYLTPEAKEPPADLLIFAVKFPVLDTAIAQATNQVGDHTIILSVMNGISSEEIIGERFGAEHMLYCVAQGMDATRDGNRLTYSSVGQLVFGEIDNSISPKVKSVQALFDRVGLAYIVPEDMKRMMWNKFMLNVGINQAVTAYETNYGGVQRDGEPREQMIAAMREVITIANRKGIDLNEDDIQTWMGVLAPFNPELMPSMRQDSAARRKSEVELFSGTVIRLAKELAIPVPVNEFFYRRIKEIESGY